MPPRIDPALIPSSPQLQFEAALWQAGVQLVAGIDEAGRGALAGPVAAGVVILPADSKVKDGLSGVRDSKQMTPRQREIWAQEIGERSLAQAVAFASSQEIDALGIIPATRLAARRALDSLLPTAEHLLIDALLLPEVSTPQTSLLKGDARSLSIACASVLAKVARDAHLRALDEDYPEYGFAAHKGYGTLSHREAIELWGASEVHRLSYAPLRVV